MQPLAYLQQFHMSIGAGLIALFLLFLAVVVMFCYHNITRGYKPERDCKEHNKIV